MIWIVCVAPSYDILALPSSLTVVIGVKVRSSLATEISAGTSILICPSAKTLFVVMN